MSEPYRTSEENSLILEKSAYQNLKDHEGNFRRCEVQSRSETEITCRTSGAVDVTDKQQVGHAARIVLKVFPVRNLREHREKMFLFIQLEVRMDGQHVRALKDAGYFTFV